MVRVLTEAPYPIIRNRSLLRLFSEFTHGREQSKVYGSETTVNIPEQYAFLSQLFDKVPPAQKQVLACSVNTLLGSESDEERKRLIVLKSIFETDSTNNLIRDLDFYNINIDALDSLLDHQAIYTILELLLKSPYKKDYGLQIAVLLSQTSMSQAPKPLVDLIKPLVSDIELNLEPGFSFWKLCPSAEPRLTEAIKDQAVILVNNHLLLKFKGRMSALCLQTFQTPDGFIFLEGVWYSPTDKNTRNFFEQSFDQGLSHITTTGGAWAVMRPLQNYIDEAPSSFFHRKAKIKTEVILKKAKKYVSKIPDKYAKEIGMIPRWRYRELERERFD